MPTEINPIPGALMLPQFQNTVADGLAIAQASCLNSLQPNPHPGLRLLVAQGLKPRSGRLLTADSLVSKNFNHEG